MSSFQRPPTAPDPSLYRFSPPLSTAFGSLSSLRAELDALRSSELCRVRPEENNQHLQCDHSMKSDVIDAHQRINITLPNTAGDNSPSSRPCSDYLKHVSTTATTGLPLDLSTKTGCDPVKSEAKRSRRKGKAFKVDADRFNSGSRDDDSDPVGRFSFVTDVNSSWLVTGDLERAFSCGSSLNGRTATSDRNIIRLTAPRSGDPRRSDVGCDTEHRASTSADSGGSYHECRHCGLGFRDGELFVMHMDFHGQPDPFTCNFCGAATGNQVEFFLHVAHAPHNVRPVYVM